MIKIGVADYGLNVWFGGLYDYKDRLEMLRRVGFDGIERLEARTEAEVINFSAEAKRLGMDFGTCRGGTPYETIKWSAAIGKKYVWAESGAKDFDTLCRHINYQTETAAKYGLKVGIHNHLGSLVESQQELVDFLKACPETGLILDDAHLAGANGNPIEIIEKYFNRIVAVHVKDYVIKDASAIEWYNRLRFCGLGGGEMGSLNKEVIKLLVKKGYDGWIYLEHDTHLQEAEIDLKISREYIKSCGL
ncbi:MAG: sugar phosphate isomerase/epimerase [Monoglobales bacterium]